MLCICFSNPSLASKPHIQGDMSDEAYRIQNLDCLLRDIKNYYQVRSLVVLTLTTYHNHNHVLSQSRRRPVVSLPTERDSWRSGFAFRWTHLFQFNGIKNLHFFSNWFFLKTVQSNIYFWISLWLLVEIWRTCGWKISWFLIPVDCESEIKVYIILVPVN